MATLIQPSMQHENTHPFKQNHYVPQHHQRNQLQHPQQHHPPHHHHHHHHHHNRHVSAPPYQAAVPIIFHSSESGGQVVQTNFYKQINIIPGLDAENAIVDTGIKLFRPSINQTQVASQITNEYDGKRMRRSIQRRTVDYNASTIQMLKHRLYRRSILQKPVIQPDPLYYTDIVQPKILLHNPVYSVTTRFVRASTNKIRCPVFTVAWTPEGRRVLTGTSSGEFTLWNGLTFNFETILQAHDCAVRAMEWSHNDMWLLSGDHNGVIKYWQSNMNNVKMIQAHNDPIRGVSFCPTDNKFVTCSDDGLLKVWDFYRCIEENILRGHGADVKCVGWHPSKCMVASGSKDSQQPLKLWDPRSATSLATIHSHKSTVMDLHWNQNGNWLLSGSRDRLVKVFDIRVMKEIHTFRGHKKEAASVNWHPIYENMFATGGSDGSIMFWLMGCDKELGVIEGAHDGMIWDLKWHPLGHILCSGSNDHTTKFWTRNRPGDKMRDKYNLNVLPAGYEDDYEYEIPNTSQSEDSTMEYSNLNNTIDISNKDNEKNEKPDLNSPVIKVLLEQASLEVSKPQKNELPAQIFTVSRSRGSDAYVPTFKIDVSIQREAIEEVERLEIERERLLREGIERTKRRKVEMDENSAIAANAPSLLDMNIEVPDFLKGQEWEEGDEPYIEDAKQRAARRGDGSDKPAPSKSRPPLPQFNEKNKERGPPNKKFAGPPNFHNAHDEPNNQEQRFDGPPFDGQRMQPFDEGNPENRFEGHPGPNFNRPRGRQYDGPGGQNFDEPRGPPNFEGPGRPNFDGPGGPKFDGPGGPNFDGPAGPNFDGPGGHNFDGPGGHNFDGPGGHNFDGPGGHNFDGPGGHNFDGPGGPNFDGPSGPNFDGPVRPNFDGPVEGRFDGHGGPPFDGPGGPNSQRFHGPRGPPPEQRRGPRKDWDRSDHFQQGSRHPGPPNRPHSNFPPNSRNRQDQFQDRNYNNGDNRPRW